MKKNQSDEKNQVMFQWKKAYLEALIDELRPFGDVLEVGFGLGDSANRIQTFHPKSHTIIVQDHENAKKARDWAKKYQNVSVIEGSWQEVLPQLKTFDAIFINSYPIDNEMGMISRIDPKEISLTSEQAKELLGELQIQLSQLSVRFSDKEIEDFFQKIGQFNKKELPAFFEKLREYKYITEQQYSQAVQKYAVETEGSEDKTEELDNDLAFLIESLAHHMHQGSRFSCFSNTITSKYEDAQFFERIITNPFIDYHEKVVSIDIPNFSKHYKLNQALVMVVEKFS